MTDDTPESGSSLAQRVRREIVRYAAISLYLYICFGAILLYKASVLRFHGVEYAPYGLSAIKALVLGKFMMIGHAMRLGERRRYKRLIFAILGSMSLFLACLVVLSVAEEIITAAMHGETALQSLEQFAGGSWLQVAAVCILMALILLPYFAFRQLSEALGEGKLRQILLQLR